MKKALFSFLVLAAILATSTAWAQGVSRRYDLNAVSGRANAAISRVGQVETRVGQVERDLVTANGRVAQLATDLATLKASRSASAGAIRRANEALAAAQSEVQARKADLVAEKHKAEVKAATDQAGKERLAVLLAEGGARIKEWNYFLPTEDPITGLVRQKCPEGTTPEYIDLGTTRRFDCRSLLKASDLTAPAASQPTSKYVKCLVWGAVGGATVGGGSYAIARAAERDYGFWDAAGASGIGVAAGYGICLLASD